MPQYLHYYRALSAFTEDYNGDAYIEPWVSYTEENDAVDYNKPDYNTQMLTFEAITDGYINFVSQSYGIYEERAIEYSKNGGDWVTISASSSAQIPVVTGDKVYFKGNNDYYYTSYWAGGITAFYTAHFSTTCQFKVYGNILSMIYGDEYQSHYSFPENTTYNFASLFSNCTGLTDANNLKLNAVNEGCYNSLFSGCLGLTKSPKLPSTTLARRCYGNMFMNCTSLITAPELHATTMAPSCYSSMFKGCTSLTTAPELPAEVLADQCYFGMFQGCTSLTSAPELPATTLAQYCYTNMFDGCASLISAPDELPAAALTEECYREMFRGCVNLVQAPELPAQILVTRCYASMFLNCSNISHIKCLATNISANACTSGWVNHVSPTGNFVANDSSVQWQSGANGIPAGWTIEYEN